MRVKSLMASVWLLRKAGEREENKSLVFWIFSKFRFRFFFLKFLSVTKRCTYKTDWAFELKVFHYLAWRR